MQTMNDLSSRLHSEALVSNADDWQELQDIAETMAEEDEDLSIAGIEFNRIVSIAERRGESVQAYLDSVADRRDELMHDLFLARKPQR